MDAPSEVLAQLRDIRLPMLSDGSILADWAAGCALGLLLALVVVLLARAFVRRPPSRRETALADLAASRTLAPAERLLAQARILQDLAPPVKDRIAAEDSGNDWSSRLGRSLGTDFFTTGAGAGLSESLYRRESGLDPEDLDRELQRLLNRTRARLS